MTGEDIASVMIGTMLVKRIQDLACAFTRKKREQDTLVAKAWCAIAERFSGKTDEYYLRTAYAVMRHHYEIYQMPEPECYVSWDPGIRRAGKYVKSMVKYPPNSSTYTSEGI
jgi:hypothetical protein